jgi:hypothetical protein
MSLKNLYRSIFVVFAAFRVAADTQEWPETDSLTVAE